MGSSVILPPPGQPATGADPNFTSGSMYNLATFRLTDLTPPSNLYVTRNDSLQLDVFNSNANIISVDLHYRLLVAQPAGFGSGQPDHPAPADVAKLPQNVIVGTQRSFIPDATRLRNIFFVPLTEGFLLNLSVGITGNSRKGQTYIELHMQKGDALGGPQFTDLLAGYLTAMCNLVWPLNAPVHSIDGAGWKHSLQFGQPAAGADFTNTNFSNQRLRIESIVAQLAAANAGTPRAVELIVDDGINVVFRIAANATQAINTTAQYVVGSLGTPSTIVTTDLQINIPNPLILMPGWRIRTATTNINAADQWSNIWANVEEWIEQ